jgi:hypothetical protein
MPARYGQSSTRTAAIDIEISDDEDEQEMMMDHRYGNGNGNGNGHGDGEDEDLTQWTLDTFKSKPVGPDAVNTVSYVFLFADHKLTARSVQCTPKWRNR